MFKVTFRNAANDRNLTDTVFLPELPAKGERIEIRDDHSDWRPVTGVVTERQWFIFNKDPGSSDVVVMVAVDRK